MKTSIGETLSLQGISAKGKQRVKSFGNNGWEILNRIDRVQFSSENGPWLLIDNGVEDARRWIHETQDKDFSFVVVANNEY